MPAKQQSISPVSNPQILSTAPNRYARSESGQREYMAHVLGMPAPSAKLEWQAEADAHYRRIYPTAGNPPRTLKPSTMEDLRDRVQVTQIRELAHAAGRGIRSRHHYARRED
jgi:hypothetical protein